MGYYIRILGTRNPNIDLDEIISELINEGLNAKFNIDSSERPTNWTTLNVTNLRGEMLCRIERNRIIDGEIGKEELNEFKEEIKHCKPNSAVKWLDKYFDKIEVIYNFQLLDASLEDENFTIVSSIKSTIWAKTGGILQADNEGFSNESGYHILWQFSDNATGEWNMAVRNLFGKWTNFKMELGDKKQREEFMKGNVPNGVIKI
jgi:hypothetical protein